MQETTSSCKMPHWYNVLKLLDFQKGYESVGQWNTNSAKIILKSGNYKTLSHFFHTTFVPVGSTQPSFVTSLLQPTISWTDCHYDLPPSLLHALLPPLGPWHPDRTHGCLCGQAQHWQGWGGSSPCWRPWAGGQSTYRALGAAPALSVPTICHLGPKLPDCTSFLLIRSFPTS